MPPLERVAHEDGHDEKGGAACGNPPPRARPLVSSCTEPPYRALLGIVERDREPVGVVIDHLRRRVDGRVRERARAGGPAGAGLSAGLLTFDAGGEGLPGGSAHARPTRTHQQSSCSASGDGTSPLSGAPRPPDNMLDQPRAVRRGPGSAASNDCRTFHYPVCWTDAVRA